MSETTSGCPSPTFSRDIAPLFTQYDAIQMGYSIDLRSYEDVKKHAEEIFLVVQKDPDNPGQSKLPGIPLMPLYEAPWTEKMIGTFGAWMEAGYPPGDLPPAPPVPGPEVPLFVALSEALSGLEGLDGDPVLAQIYLDRLANESTHGAALPALFDQWKSIEDQEPSMREQKLRTTILADETLAALAREIVLLWYNATINGVFGTPEDNQYTKAKVWPTAQCHPMGWATENVPFYWQYKPEGSSYTGLAPAPQKPTVQLNSTRRGNGA